MKHPELTLILPIQNEAAIISAVYRDIHKVLDALRISYECILVENGSTDATLPVIKQLAKKYKNTSVAVAPPGYGSAVLAGLARTRGTYVCYMPSDGQIDLTVFPALWKLAKTSSWDIVKVKRSTRESFLRTVTSTLFSKLTTVLFGIPAIDINGSPRIFKRTLLPHLQLSYPDSFIDTEFAVKGHRLNLTIHEIPMKTLPRVGGRSTRSYKTFLEFFKNLLLFKLRTMQGIYTYA